MKGDVMSNCAGCNGPLKNSQTEAIGLLYRAGFQGVKAYCEKCDVQKPVKPNVKNRETKK